MSYNARILQSYQDKTQEYIKVHRFGRDAEYIRQQGFDIECSDAVPNFVELLQQKGFESRLLNLLSDDLGTGYQMVLADAVFASLVDDSIFALRMKQGDGPV